MGTKTEYYDFNLPADTDYADQNQFNENFEVLDTTLHNMQGQINSIAAGLKYKGAVNYYSQLPSNAEIGDAYTVLYAGSSGTVPDGTEYVWGELNGTAQWIDFSKDTYTKAEVDALLAAKQALLNANNKLDPAYINYDSAHRAVSDTEKVAWNGKQNALSSEQLAAVNSGIDSTKVEQIEINKTNILTLETADGAKNLLRNTAVSGNGSQVTWTVNADGTVSTSGTTNAANLFIDIGTYTFENGKKYIVSGCPSGGSVNGYRITNHGGTLTINDFGSGVEITGNGSSSTIAVYANNSGTNMSGLTFKPMVCTKEAWEISHSYQPYAMSNSELTTNISSLTTKSIYTTNSYTYSAETHRATFASLLYNAATALGVDTTTAHHAIVRVYTDTVNTSTNVGEYVDMLAIYQHSTSCKIAQLTSSVISYFVCNNVGTVVVENGTAPFYASVQFLD